MWLLVCLFILPLGYAHGSLAEQMAEITQLCCNQGTTYARNHSAEDCSSSIPPDVPSTFGKLCIFAMDQCCKEYFTKKVDCEIGIEMATNSKSCASTKDSAKKCCDQCMSGVAIGKTRGASSCSAMVRGSSAEQLLAGDAFAQCCKNVADNVSNTSSTNSGTISKKPKPDFSILPSVCEEYAPNELCAHHCIPIPGSYKCQCNPGFMLMPDGRNCREVVKNRCKPYNPCQHKCNDNGIHVKCSCRRGYQLMTDRKSCEDINECLLDSPVCLPNTQCYNIVGSYKCIPMKKPKNNVEKGSCPPGFSKNLQNTACDDINECNLPNPPCPSYLCENTIGGYKCGGVSGDPVNLVNKPKTPVEDRCPPGFVSGSNEECEDIDECSSRKDDCNKISQFCINTRGSFHCQDKGSKHCPPGFKTNSITNKCEDINECDDGQDICREDQICINVPGEYDCKPRVDPRTTNKDCPDGMRRNPTTNICEDIDECAQGTHLCDQYQNCINTNGSHECRCKLGFELDSTTGACIDINECATDQNNCVPETQRCDNTVGSFLCVRFLSCGTGYILQHSSSTCEDIDECALGIHNCDRAGPEYQCFNIPGSFRCNKRPPPVYDYYYDSEEEVDEKTTNTTVAEIITTTTAASTAIETPQTTPKIISTDASSERPTVQEEQENPDDNIIDFNNISQEPETKELQSPIVEIDKENFVPESPMHPEYPYQPNYENFEPKVTEQPKTKESEKNNIHEYESTKPSEYPSQPNYEKSEPQPTEPSKKDETHVNELEPSSPSEYQPNYEKIEPQSTLPPRIQDRNTYFHNTEPSIQPEYPFQNGNREISPTVIDSQPQEPVPIAPKQPSYYEPTTERLTPEIDNNIPVVYPKVTETTYRPIAEYPTAPYGVFVSVGRDTENGERKHDSSVSVDTDTLPKTPWTAITEKPIECMKGFELNEYGACFDIDECVTNRHSCSGLTESCRNTMGGYLCDCAIGFRRDLASMACTPISFTASSTSRFTSTSTSTSTTSSTTTTTTTTTTPAPTTSSTKKSYFWGYEDHRLPTRTFRPRNNCDVGYHLNVETGQCEDVNECTNGQANCAAAEICVNTDGGFQCKCPPRWLLDPERHRCVPIRKKGQFPPGYRNEPVYPPADPNDIIPDPKGTKTLGEPEITKVEDRGSVYQCPWGTRLGVDNTCEDINECATGEAQCGPLQVCTNLHGGYTCSCPVGHRWIGDHQCEDVDECALGGNVPICSQNADCINTVGSYQCRCHEGFRSAPVNEKVCVDVDECSESRPGSLCQQRCNNVWGGYRCSCHRGYRLNPDNRTCYDIDECTEFKNKHICVGRCHNEPGSYRCSCPAGYKLSEDKKSCIDIDECENGEAHCSQGAQYGGSSNVCLNTRGSYRCHKITCPYGYQLQSRHRCSKIETTCPPSDWECAHQPSTYSYNFITFVSNLYIPESKVDLFTMRGPAWPGAKMRFELKVVNVDAPPSVKEKADINSFLLIQTANQAVLSLVRPLQGLQSIELELSMELYSRGQFGGIAVAKIYIYVSEYEF